MECHIRGCTNLPSLYCTCSTSMIYSCPSHLGRHLSVQTLKKHNVFSTVKFVQTNLKETLKNSIINTIKQFKELKKQIHDISKTAHEKIFKSILKVDKMICFHRGLLKEIITENQATVCVSHNKKFRNNNFNCEMLSLIKKELFLSLNFPSITNIIDYLSKLGKDFIKPKYDTNLHYFITNSNIISLFDSRNFTYFQKEIPNP